MVKRVGRNDQLVQAIQSYQLGLFGYRHYYKTASSGNSGEQLQVRTTGAGVYLNPSVAVAGKPFPCHSKNRLRAAVP